jgi:hypothetical protein
MGKNSVKRRRENLFAADPHCHWCGRRVYCHAVQFIKGEVIPADFATLDHLNQKSQRRPRPEKGSTVLSCHECNQKRGREANAGRRRYLLPCTECGQHLCPGPFHSAGCWEKNTARLSRSLRPWEKDRIEVLRARRKAKRKRHRKNRARRNALLRTIPGDQNTTTAPSTGPDPRTWVDATSDHGRAPGRSHDQSLPVPA